MIWVIGEVLIDQFPDYRRIGGAPLNFAVHLHRFGYAVRLVTRVGDDQDGRQIIAWLEQHGLSTADVQVDATHPTGQVNVSLDADGSPAFDIVAPAAYDYIDLRSLSNAGKVDDAELVYFGSLAQRGAHGFHAINRWLDGCPSGIRRFCDINLRPPHDHPTLIEQCVRQADVLKLNDQELLHVGRLLGHAMPPQEIVSFLMHTYRIEAVALTRGSAGSTFFSSVHRVDSPAISSVEVRDTVGAGDAFAAVLAAGVLRHEVMPDVLAAATEFAAYICTQPGAVGDDTDVYEQILQKMGGATS